MNEKNETILVLNPNTGSHFNVGPLFAMMEKFCMKDFNDLAKLIDDTIRHMVTTMDLDENTSVTVREVSYQLYDLRDAFCEEGEFVKRKVSK